MDEYYDERWPTETELPMSSNFDTHTAISCGNRPNSFNWVMQVLPLHRKVLTEPPFVCKSDNRVYLAFYILGWLGLQHRLEGELLLLSFD